MSSELNPRPAIVEVHLFFVKGQRATISTRLEKYRRQAVPD